MATAQQIANTKRLAQRQATAGKTTSLTKKLSTGTIGSPSQVTPSPTPAQTQAPTQPIVSGSPLPTPAPMATPTPTTPGNLSGAMARYNSLGIVSKKRAYEKYKNDPKFAGFDRGDIGMGTQTNTQTQQQPSQTQQQPSQQQPTPTEQQQPEPTTPEQPQPGQEPSYTDDSDERAAQIVSNLDQYKQTAPAMFANKNTFYNNFDYAQRTPKQKQVLDSWYQSNIVDAGRINSYMTRSASDLSNMYSAGALSDNDLQSIQTRDPAKYAAILEAKEKKDRMNQASSLLYGGEEEQPQNNMQQLLQQQVQDLMKASEAPSDMFASYKEALNSESITKAKTSLIEKEGEMNELDLQIRGIQDEVEKQYEGTGATKGVLAAIAQDRQKALIDKKNSMSIEYNTLLNKYNSETAQVKDDFDMQMKEYEMNRQASNDKMQKLGFMMNLMSFETPQQKDDRERNKFVKQQAYAEGDILSSDPKVRARAVSNAVDRVLKEFEGIPMQRSREQMVSDIQSMVDQGKDLGQAITDNIRKPIMNKPEYKIWSNNRLGISNDPVSNKIVSFNGVDYMMDSKGNLTVPNINTIDPTKPITGSLASTVIQKGGIGAIADQLAMGQQYNCGDRGQCGEWFNDAFGGANGTRVGNSYKSKTDLIDKSILQGQAGMGVVLNYGNNTTEYGHVGILSSGLYTNEKGVQGYDMVSANIKGNEKLSKVFVPASLISSSKGGFIPSKIPVGGTQSTNISPEAMAVIDGTAKITDIPSGERIRILQEIKGNGKQLLNQKTVQMADNTISLIDQIVSSPGFSGSIGMKSLGNYIPGSPAYDTALMIETLKSQLAIPGLENMKGLGAMSEKEFSTMSAAQSILNTGLSEASFKKELDRIKISLNTMKNRNGGGTTGSGQNQGSGTAFQQLQQKYSFGGGSQGGYSQGYGFDLSSFQY